MRELTNFVSRSTTREQLDYVEGIWRRTTVSRYRLCFIPLVAIPSWLCYILVIFALPERKKNTDLLPSFTSGTVYQPLATGVAANTMSSRTVGEWLDKDSGARTHQLMPMNDQEMMDARVLAAQTLIRKMFGTRLLPVTLSSLPENTHSTSTSCSYQPRCNSSQQGVTGSSSAWVLF